MAERQADGGAEPPKRRRRARKTWLIIIGVFFGLAFIGNLLPDRPSDTGPSPVAIESRGQTSSAPSTTEPVTTTPLATTSTPPPPPPPPPPPVAVDPVAEANDWWFNRKGFLIGGYIDLLSRYVQQVQSGDMAGAVVTCGQLQNTEISSIDTPHEVFGPDVTTMFDLGSGGLLIAADKCQEFFKDGDAKDLNQSLQMAGDGANALGGVRVEIFEKHIMLS